MLPFALRTGGVRPAAGAVAPGMADDAARRASAIAVAWLCLLLIAKLAEAAIGGPAQVPFVVALVILPLLYAIPGTRPLLARHRWLVLAGQAVLTGVPLVIFGASWAPGVSGLLGGLVLLMVGGWVSWLLAGGMMLTETVVRATLTGLPGGPTWLAVISVPIYFLDNCLPFFALVRLAQMVGQVQGARRRAADFAVARERLELAAALRAAVGQRIADVAALAAATRRVLRGDPEQARERITAAGATARDAVARARAVTADHRDLPRPEPAAPSPPQAVIGARLAWAVLVTVLLAYATANISYVAASDYGSRLTALVVADIILVVALQLYHSWSARQGGRPRVWPLTLGLQALLVYAAYLPPVAAYAGGLAGFLAGSFLLLLPGRWRWPGYAAVVASSSLLWVTVSLRGVTIPGDQRVPTAIYNAAVFALGGLMVYGLSRLADMARQLEALRGQLTRVAAVQERLRIARDVHDLLGLGLSAIALKADLVAKLIGRDDARAAAETREIGRICAAARADIRLVTGDGRRLSLAAELDSGREILASAGVEVRVETDTGPLPEAADTVLAPVLREAVTNILRHSTAAACAIDVATDAGWLRLHVGNDGVTAQPGPAAAGAGRGLANLTARVQAAGGRLITHQADQRFDLMAEIPLPVPVGAGPAARTAAARRPAGSR